MDKLSINNYGYLPWNIYFKDSIVSLSKMNTALKGDWKEVFENVIEHKNLLKIEKYLSHALLITEGKVKIYPYPELIYNAFYLTPLDDIKVVFLGQDPYHQNEIHNGKLIPQAMGLSFSVPVGMKIPSSLKNIYNNLLKFKHIDESPVHGNLSKWANRGCLMLNTSLTVQHGHAGSHCKFWRDITDQIISYISMKKENIVFILWGKPALNKLDLIDSTKHKAIISSHPSGLSFTHKLGKYPSFAENDHFGQINDFLEKKKIPKIDWKL